MKIKLLLSVMLLALLTTALSLVSRPAFSQDAPRPVSPPSPSIHPKSGHKQAIPLKLPSPSTPSSPPGSLLEKRRKSSCAPRQTGRSGANGIISMPITIGLCPETVNLWAT
ncbi:MAG: hypothetical protein M5U34_07745 [Chloroflexi bacterium]|nr:hypothetical protein [Chloroflexota bacterium]